MYNLTKGARKARGKREESERKVMNKYQQAISYFEDAVKESDEIIAECSSDLQAGLIMANTINYQCSNCGQSGEVLPIPGIPESMFIEGFRAHGDVLYCHDCVKTWKERNGAEYDEQYNNPPHLFAMWWNKQVQEQITDKSKIKTHRRNCVGDFVEAE